MSGAHDAAREAFTVAAIELEAAERERTRVDALWPERVEEWKPLKLKNITRLYEARKAHRYAYDILLTISDGGRLP